LVLAIIVSIISIVVRVSIDSVDEGLKEEAVSEHSSVQGTVQLIVQKSGGKTNGEG
jgi:hypothetical protein